MDWTLVVGIVVAAASYLLKTFTVEPLVRYRAVVGRIGASLDFHSNKIYNPGDLFAPDEIADLGRTCRQLSVDLGEAYNAIGWVRPLSWIGVVPNRETITTASGALIAISNSVGRSKPNYEMLARLETTVRKGLGIPGWERLALDG